MRTLLNTPSSPSARLRDFLADYRRWVIYAIFIAVTAFFMLAAPNFATSGTAAAIGRITAVVSIVAVGMTFVIISGEIDLSVGSVISMSAMLVALLMSAGVPGPVAALLTIAFGALVGVINGLLVTRVGIPSFLVTLGMLSVLGGLALTVTGSLPVSIASESFANVFANGALLGIPSPVAWTVVVAALGYYLLHQTLYGRRVYAVGGNLVAARFSGLNVNLVKIMVFVLSSSAAALGGLVLAARSSGGNPSVGQGLELDVIAAVILGGTSLFGGRGHILGSIFGAVFIGILGFGLIVMGLSTSIQEIIKGAIIILAVALTRR